MAVPYQPSTQEPVVELDHECLALLAGDLAVYWGFSSWAFTMKSGNSLD
jgi:hypothetical protein